MKYYFQAFYLIIQLIWMCEAVPLASPPPHSDENFTLPTEPTSDLNFRPEWTNWKLQNEKRYENAEEDSYRRDVWLSNKMYIEGHNMNWAEKSGFKLAMNEFGDLVSSIGYSP